MYGGESGFEFRHGDVIRNDYVMCTAESSARSPHRGQRNPFERTRCRTRPCRDIYRGDNGEARPGGRACDVHRFAQDAFHGSRNRRAVSIAGTARPRGGPKAPYLVPACETLIEAGMVLAFEPHVNEFHLQDMYLIRDDAQELLSPCFGTDAPMVVG